MWGRASAGADALPNSCMSAVERRKRYLRSSPSSFRYFSCKTLAICKSFCIFAPETFQTRYNYGH